MGTWFGVPRKHSGFLPHGRVNAELQTSRRVRFLQPVNVFVATATTTDWKDGTVVDLLNQPVLSVRMASLGL